MKIQNNAWVFQNSVTTIGNGETLYPNYNDQITIFITGTSTSRTIHFEGSDNDGNFYAIPAVKLPELTIASSTTGNNEVWVINATSWVSIRCRISAINGGTVKIIGKVVDSGINLISSAKVTAELSGSKLEEQLTQADAVANVLTFSANISAIEIFHEETTWQTFIVNSLTLKIPAGGWARPIGGTPSTEVTIPAGIDCAVGRLT